MCREVQEALNQLVVVPLSHSALEKLTAFDCHVSRCFDPNEELRLRHVIDAIGCELFESKIRQLGQLIVDRELTRSRGLLVDAMCGEKHFDELSGPLKEAGVQLEEAEEGDVLSI